MRVSEIDRERNLRKLFAWQNIVETDAGVEPIIFISFIRKRHTHVLFAYGEWFVTLGDINLDEQLGTASPVERMTIASGPGFCESGSASTARFESLSAARALCLRLRACGFGLSPLRRW